MRVPILSRIIRHRIYETDHLATAFLILIAILLARPAGIMGRREVEKV